MVDEQGAAVCRPDADLARSVSAELESIFAGAGAWMRAGEAVVDRSLDAPAQPAAGRERGLIASAGIILAAGLVGLAIGVSTNVDLIPPLSAWLGGWPG